MPRTRGETDPVTGFRRASLYFSTAMVNAYYIYFVDEDFGPLLPQVLLVLPVHRAPVPERPRVRQALAAPARDRVRGARQRHPQLRRPRGPAGDLPRAHGGAHRGPAAQMAGAAAAPLHVRGPARRLPVPGVDPAGRAVAHASLRPPPAGPPVLRGDHPREPRPRAARVRAAAVPPAHHQAHALALPHARAHRRRGALAAFRLQADPRQAILQARPCPAHRDHRQQHPRLRRRQAAAQPREDQSDRLPSQPTPAARPAPQPRLHAGSGVFRALARAAEGGCLPPAAPAQVPLPLSHGDSIPVNPSLSILRVDGSLIYFHGLLPVHSHPADSPRERDRVISLLVSLGTATAA